jgi:putative transposase
MGIVEAEAPRLGVQETCRTLGLSRATYYRRRKMESPPAPRAKPGSPRKLSSAEERQVLSQLTSERFIDCSVPEVYATLLDEGLYLCGPRTMYRILEKHRAVRERRHQRRHPDYPKAELLAEAPNQVWSWDISVPQQAA